MAGSVKGLVIEIGGDTSGLQKALSKVNSSTASLSKELRGVNSLLKLNPKNTELVSQKQQILKESIEQTSEKLEELRKTQEMADKEIANGTKVSEENYRSLQREIIYTQNKLNNLKAEASNWTKAGRSIEEFGNKVENISNKINKIGTTLTTNLTLPIVGLTTTAIASMDAVDEGLDTIATKTGATGTEAKELQRIYKEVASEVPGEFEDIGAAIGEINTRLDFTGDKLKTASVDFLKFAKVNGTDVNTSVQLVTRAMGDAGIEADKYSELLDMLTVAGQKSGISIESLTTNLAKYGAPMRALGIDTKNAIAMFAGWEKAGVNTEIAFSGMKKAISNWGAAGKDSTKEFSKTLKEIEKCPTIAKATTKAIEVFGSKAGPDLADAIKGGRFEFQKYIDALDKGAETIESTYSQIIDEVDDTQLAMQNAKIAMHDAGEIAAKSLGPILLDLSKKFKGLMERFDKLSDKEKKQILNMALMVASIGPAIKILSTFGNTIGSGIKRVGSFSQAIGLIGKTSTDAFKNASEGTQNLAKSLTFLTSPAGLAITSITLLAGALVYFATKQTEAQKEAKKLADTQEEAKKKLEEYNSEIDKNRDAELSHINSVQSLRDELTKLVDENGKVKEGYEGRVSFILNEMNNALGTEYKLNENVIDSYKTLQAEIDKTIEKKRAEIKLNADEEKYKNAIENQKQAVEELKNVQDKLGMSYDEVREKYGKYIDKINNGTLTVKDVEEIGSTKEYKKIQQLAELSKAYESAKAKVKIYTDDVKTYEDEYAKYTEGKYSEISNIITTTTEDWTTKTLEQLTTSISEQGNSLEQYKNIYETTGNEVALQLAQQAQNNLDKLAAELANRTQTLTELGPNEISAWKNIAEQSYSSYSTEISKMSPEMQQKIQDATGIIAAGTPQMQEKAKELGKKTVDEFDKNADAKQKALNTITGYLNGLSDEQKRELLQKAGIENVDKVLEELNRGDLSEENGKNILEGLWKGLQNGTWQGKILGVAAGLADAVNKKFTGKSGWDEHSPSKKMKKFAEYYIQPISDVMNKRKRGILNTAQSLVSGINDKFDTNLKTPSIQDFGKLQGNLSGKVIDGTKTVFTTPQIIFNVQELDKDKLEQCFNYVNKKFGSQY